MTYNVGSLFAGVGGICLGFKNARTRRSRYKLKWANEIDQKACITYRQNFEHSLFEGDIEKIIIPEREEDSEQRELYYIQREQILNTNIDILTAGFPCQAFSIAGERRGFEDDRGNLFWSIVNLINLLDERGNKPSIIFLENVKNLRTHDNGNTYATIKSEMENLGYIIKDSILNTKDFTRLPQNRERIFIVGFLDSRIADKFTMFDNLQDYKICRTEKQRINDIKKVLELNCRKENLEEFYYTKDKYPNYFLTKKQYMSISESKRKKNRINLEEQITEQYEFYQVRRSMYVRKNKSGVCPTLTANMGTGGHNVPLIKVDDGIRKLTPSETFRLQGFPIGNGYELPDGMSNGALYKQAGNAVSVDIITLIAKEILRALEVVADGM